MSNSIGVLGDKLMQASNFDRQTGGAKRGKYVSRITEFARRRMECDPRKIPLRNNNVFIVGGITHVPKQDFPTHIGTLRSVFWMLGVRYGLNVATALLDNEFDLYKLPPEERPQVCYRIDQMCVDNASFIIAELSTPSTGTGQELERAAQEGVPVIGMVRGELRAKVTPTVSYCLLRNDGVLEERAIQRGSGGISLMVEGNPSLVDLIVYANNGNDGITEALHMLDASIQYTFGLTPINVRLREALKMERTSEGVFKIKRMIELAESTLFYPLGYPPEEYMRFFPNTRGRIHPATGEKNLPYVDIDHPDNGKKR